MQPADGPSNPLDLAPAPKPVIPIRSAATWQQIAALGRYMTRTEVHTYAFSVAAQVILSLFPFIVLLLTLSQRVFRGSPVERRRRDTSRRKQFRRNLAIAMGNSGDAGFLPQLEAWAASGDAVLAETAAWASARLRNTSGATPPASTK